MADINMETYVFVSRTVMQLPDWMVSKAIAAAHQLAIKHPEMSVFVTPSITRSGDFVAVLFKYRPQPDIVALIAIPAEARSPIVQELFTKE